MQTSLFPHGSDWAWANAEGQVESCGWGGSAGAFACLFTSPRRRRCSLTRGHRGAASVPSLGMTPDAGVQERYSSSRPSLLFSRATCCPGKSWKDAYWGVLFCIKMINTWMILEGVGFCDCLFGTSHKCCCPSSPAPRSIWFLNYFLIIHSQELIAGWKIVTAL